MMAKVPLKNDKYWWVSSLLMGLGVEGLKIILCPVLLTYLRTRTHTQWMSSCFLSHWGREDTDLANQLHHLLLHRGSPLFVFISSLPLLLSSCSSRVSQVPTQAQTLSAARRNFHASCHPESDLFNKEMRLSLSLTSFWFLSETKLWIESWLVVLSHSQSRPQRERVVRDDPFWVIAPPTDICRCIQINSEVQEHPFQSPWKLIYRALSCLSLVITSVQLFTVTTSCICSTHCQGLYLETDGNVYCCQKTMLRGSTVKQQHVPWQTSHYIHTSLANGIQLDLRIKAPLQDLRSLAAYIGSILNSNGTSTVTDLGCSFRFNRSDWSGTSQYCKTVLLLLAKTIKGSQ